MPRLFQPAAAETTDKPARGERRKRETRTRLLDAALRLMAEKGMEGVAINEITEAADVGFGSFYNHFDSKEAIHAALLDWVFEEFGNALGRLVHDVSDPAEVIAICVRHTILRARREPLWGRLLVREGFSAKVLERGLGRRLLNDIAEGVRSKRFPNSDILMMVTAAGGTVLATISIGLQFETEAGHSPLDKAGFTTDKLPERTAATILSIFGLDPSESEAVANRPLPTSL